MHSTNHKYASFSRRLLAHNIDLLPILLLFYLASFLIPRSDYDFLIMAGIYFLYHILFEASKMQATLGKKWSKLKVYDLNGGRVSLPKAIFRNISKMLSLLLFFGGFILIIFNQNRRGLHDYIGGTLVLFEED